MRRLLIALTLLPALATAGPADLDPDFGTLGIVAGDYADSPQNRYLPLLAIGATPGGYTALIEREVATPPEVFVYRVALDDAGHETGAVSLGVISARWGGGHVYPDGRVLFAYALDAGNGLWNLHVERRRPDASPDPTFGGGDGATVIATGQDILRPETLVVSASGQIAVAGYRAFAPDFALATRDSFVLRLDGAGQQVTAFSVDGVAFVDLVPNAAESPSAVAILPAGQVLVCSEGSFGGQYDAVLTRLRSTGAVDSYGSSGILYYDSTLPAQTNQNDYCSDVDVHPVSGATFMTIRRYGDGSSAARVVPVDNAGVAGPAFDNVVAPNVGGATLRFDALGRACLAVVSRRPGTVDLDVVRFTAGGSPDAGFGVGGVVRHALPVPASATLASLTVADARLALDAKGRVLAGASYFESADDDAGWVMARLLGDALFDDGFE